MNENGLPICNITPINTVNSSPWNDIQKNQISDPQSGNNGNPNHATSSMSNSSILYVPITVQHCNGFSGKDILQQIIADDVHQPKTMMTTNVNSRNMVIKTAPHGAVQITYKKMIHSLPEYKKPIHILPKPSTRENKSNFVETPLYVSSSKTINTKDVNNMKMPIPNLLNNVDSITNNVDSISNNLLSFCPDISSSAPQCTKQNNSSDYNKSVISNNNNIDDFNCSNIYSNSEIKQVNGSSKNLYITLPKIKSPKINSKLINHDKLLYTPSHKSNFDLHHTDDLNNYEIDGVGDDISSRNINLMDGNSEHVNEIDMDLLSMDIDAYDAITMTTFLQNEPLFNTGFNDTDNYTLPTSSMEVRQTTTDNPKSSLDISSNVSMPDYTTSSINPSISDFVVQNIQPGISHTQTMDLFDCNNSVNINLSENQKLVNEINTNQNKHTSLHMNIIDVSPDTCTTSGGCKIILIGSWNTKDYRYSCRFGDQIVNAELIQNGVLRCYSPQHTAGKVKLCVLCDNGISSNEVDFFIVKPTEEKSIKHNGWMLITNKSLVLLLMERITAIANIIGIDISTELSTDIKYMDAAELKQCHEWLICTCKKLMVVKVDFSFEYNVENTMTVLHLAAALGFTKFIQLLLKWVETNPNQLIMVEACPTQFDQFSLLPIMWSSAKGHFNTTCVLHQWVESTIEEFDACGCTAIDLAKECGHETIAEYLDRLKKKSNASRKTASQPEDQDDSLAVASVETDKQFNGSFEPSGNMNGCASRTLGKTLARIQSMINDQDDVSNLNDMNLDGEKSLFETSPFTLRQGSIPEENVSLNVHNLHSSSSIATLPQSPFNEQVFQTAEFCEFFYKAKKIEKDFAELTLTDEEQQDLLRAANVIQSAYKNYKERRKRRDQEFCAAVLIQSYYRRYKQYAAFKKMQKGAVVIQNQYRAHREKSKKKVKAASTIQAYYRRYREKKNDTHEDVQMKNKLKQQADRKANRYLKQASTRFSKELPDSISHGNSSTIPDERCL